MTVTSLLRPPLESHVKHLDAEPLPEHEFRNAAEHRRQLAQAIRQMSSLSILPQVDSVSPSSDLTVNSTSWTQVPGVETTLAPTTPSLAIFQAQLDVQHTTSSGNASDNGGVEVRLIRGSTAIRDVAWQPASYEQLLAAPTPLEETTVYLVAGKVRLAPNVAQTFDLEARLQDAGAAYEILSSSILAWTITSDLNAWGAS